LASSFEGQRAWKSGKPPNGRSQLHRGRLGLRPELVDTTALTEVGEAASRRLAHLASPLLDGNL
jgi:hypothetical protein